MKEQSAAECKGVNFPELLGSKVVSVEVEGGSRFGRKVLILFDNGKTFHLDARLTISDHGILPNMEYGVGGWGQVMPGEKT